MDVIALFVHELPSAHLQTSAMKQDLKEHFPESVPKAGSRGLGVGRMNVLALDM